MNRVIEANNDLFMKQKAAMRGGGEMWNFFSQFTFVYNNYITERQILVFWQKFLPYAAMQSLVANSGFNREPKYISLEINELVGKQDWIDQS
jgi:hypothetical protein